jgi:hypothetical protein
MKTRAILFAFLAALVTACARAGTSGTADTTPGADLIFVTFNGVQTVYRCSVNTARQWPSNVTLADSLLANNCASTPMGVGGLNGKGRPVLEQGTNVSDRLWSVSLEGAAVDVVYDQCALIRSALDQGVATFSFDCSSSL